MNSQAGASRLCAYVFLVILHAFATAVTAQAAIPDDDGVPSSTVSMTPPEPFLLLNETELVDLNQTGPGGTTEAVSSVPTGSSDSSVSMTDSTTTSVSSSSSSSTSTTTITTTSVGTPVENKTMSQEEIQKLLLPPATVEADILHVNISDDNHPHAKANGNTVPPPHAKTPHIISAQMQLANTTEYTNNRATTSGDSVVARKNGC
ncbi:hypothetical protein ZHAS_00006884 [Anopheles sinensis]|uniref:Uncharacterized protein n=1 Tax=Anopheles sinensis TaxID=74873 RepID=A0A084VNJ6_ANOSI|nr:hypothetical protein ZHAS_00006884 [Anopheles sinensis]